MAGYMAGHMTVARHALPLLLLLLLLLLSQFSDE